MNFEPVWITSIEHLQRWEMIFREASALRRLVGAYRIPEGFPYSRSSSRISIWPSRWRFPVVMFSSGRLRIENQLLQYEPTAWHPAGSHLYHMKTDLRFALTALDIDRIENFEFSSPFWRYYNLPFIRVWTKRDSDLTDFLLCVGGSGPFMGKVRKQNAKLCATIRESFPTCLNGNRQGKRA